MSKVIKLELTTESIDSAIREVEAFQKYIEDKTQELLDEMARLGYETSAFNFSWAAYDGTNDVSVNWERSGENQVAVVATGNAVEKLLIPVLSFSLVLNLLYLALLFATLQAALNPFATRLGIIK